MATVHWQVLKTNFGPLSFFADADALWGVEFTADAKSWKRRHPDSVLIHKSNPILRLTIKQMREYFAGKRQEFSVPLAGPGTAFQQKAWSALQAIPYGQTWSYSQQAQHMKKPRAVRAVGSANGKNPWAIVVPCHRVIRADQSLGGFGGGLDWKKGLLALEQK